MMKSEYTNYQGEQMIEYSGLPYGWGQQAQISLANTKKNNLTYGWVLNKAKNLAFFLTGLDQITIPLKYAKLVQYVDCMIDTTAQIYIAEKEAQIYQVVDESSSAAKFLKWAEKYPKKPSYPKYNDSENDQNKYKVYAERYASWDSLRLVSLDEKIERSHYYTSLLMTARDEALYNGNSDVYLEFYVARYLSKEDALEMKRNRRVMGGCSQDLSPRYHAMQISTLAAETAKWDIFLRAHLDVMNDRFDRVSDGSYAWSGRKTYLKEIEELGIDVVDLLLGTCLRVENVDENHYFGTINRIGRALSDANDKSMVENALIEMIDDEQLDPYNRLLIAYVFDNYNANLKIEDIRKVNSIKLNRLISDWPDYLKEVWNK